MAVQRLVQDLVDGLAVVRAPLGMPLDGRSAGRALAHGGNDRRRDSGQSPPGQLQESPEGARLATGSLTKAVPLIDIEEPAVGGPVPLADEAGDLAEAPHGQVGD